MPDAINAAVGGASSNSYCTLIEATAYNDNHLYGSTWATATGDQQTRALLTATRLIDERYAFAGTRATTTQALSWPRYGVLYYTDGGGGSYIDGLFYADGQLIPSDVIPQKLKNAEAEFARQLLAGDRTADNSADAKGIASLKAGPVEVSFRANVGSKAIPDAVSQMLSGWGVNESDRSVRRLVRA